MIFTWDRRPAFTASTEIRALHQGILDAVREADAARAERLMREHLEYTEPTFFRAA